MIGIDGERGSVQLDDEDIYEGHFLNKVNFFHGVSIGSTLCICTFFNEVNSDRSFHVPEDYQNDLLYCWLYLELIT